MAKDINYLSPSTKIYMDKDDFKRLKRYSLRSTTLIIKKINDKRFDSARIDGNEDPKKFRELIDFVSFMLLFHGMPYAPSGHSFATYHDEECKIIQCDSMKNRSLTDIYVLYRTMVNPEMRWIDYKKSVILMTYIIDYYPKRISNLVRWLVCGDISDLVLSYNRHGQVITPQFCTMYGGWMSHTSHSGLLMNGKPLTLSDVFVRNVEEQAVKEIEDDYYDSNSKEKSENSIESEHVIEI